MTEIRHPLTDAIEGRERVAERVDAYLVCGGDFHDFDYARLQLLGLLAEHENVRTKVAGDFSDTTSLARSRLLVTYTCNVRPTVDQQDVLADWVAGGGRWFALHGTNTALDPTPHGYVAPRAFPKYAEVLGSQFIAHPPIAPYRVTVANPAHPFTQEIEPFDTDDELYLSETHGELEILLETRWTGSARGFVEADWPTDDPRPVAYLRQWGAGTVLYLTLGHCRGHYDMQPRLDWYPDVQRGSWAIPAYHRLLRRGLGWAIAGEWNADSIGGVPMKSMTS